MHACTYVCQCCASGHAYMVYMYVCVCVHACMETLRPINIKKGKATNPNNSFFSEKKKELLEWDSNPRHTAC